MLKMIYDDYRVPVDNADDDECVVVVIVEIVVVVGCR
jgi:hypothetical protein